MSNQIIKRSAAAALLFALPAAASAQDVVFSTAPVAVTSCTIDTSVDPRSFVGPLSFGSQQLRTQNELRLAYVNKSSLRANSVTIVLNAGNDSQRLVSTGTFSPGVHIDRSFDTTIASDGQNATCSVAEVGFVDGSTWHAASHVVVTR